MTSIVEIEQETPVVKTYGLVGDHNAVAYREFEALSSRCRKRVYNLAYRTLRHTSDAEDVTQETFLRAWMHYDRYDSRRPFEAWVLRIAANLCVDHSRRLHRRPIISLDTSSFTGADTGGNGLDVADTTQDPVLRLMQRGESEALRAALMALPDPYRSTVLLAHQDYTYEEISVLLRCSVGTVRSRVHRARVRLRRQIESDPDRIWTS